jgi:hypothetical protein
MASNSRICSTFDNLYDRIRGDREDFPDEDVFRNKVTNLRDIGLIETGVMDDFVVYSARHGLRWSEFVNIDDPIKKSILLLLVENPTTFFVLQNTQRGKMRIASLEIKQWGQDTSIKPVAFIIVDNDQTLADQSCDGIVKTFGTQDFNLFLLSSSSKVTPEFIKTYIDAYSHDDTGEYSMPVIVLLANPKQHEKMLKLLAHINNKVVNYNSKLRYGVIFDEADKTYKSLRNKNVVLGGISTSCVTYFVENTCAMHRLGFVTATDGDLLDEEYPECANAYLYPVEIDPEDEVHYRALHHQDSITNITPFKSRHTNNSYAKEVIETNNEHFITPITLPSVEVYYRKIIINSNAKTEEMKQFAKWANTNGMYALVFNGYGGASVKIFKNGSLVGTQKTKGKKFNEALFYIYKKYNLSDKPLVIIGRRKVDRGLGFHYCPRVNDEICIDGDLGPVITKNREGLVWTDMILGKIEDKNSAVQKAGRLAGIIGNSPQYPGSMYYWTDAQTEDLIRRHNTIVDKANDSYGCSILQAMKHAEDLVPLRKINHHTNINSFLVYNDEITVKDVCKYLDYHYRTTKPTEEGTNAGFIETSLNSKKDKASLIDAIKKVHTAYGGSNKKTDDAESKTAYRTYYPCYKDINDSTSLHFVVIIRPDTDSAKLQYVRNTWPSIYVPQEGDY